jgi:transposase
MYTLDRTDNDSGYRPGNVRWATRAEQNRNRRPQPGSLDEAVAQITDARMYCPLCGLPMTRSEFGAHRTQEHPAA